MSSEMQEQQMSSSASALEQLRPRTWRFDLKLHMQPLSGPDEVQAVFRSILNDAIDRIEIGLDQCCFSYGAPEEDLQIFRDFCMDSIKFHIQLCELGYLMIEFVEK